MAVQWEVFEMKVETSSSDHVQDSLFANGRMQVPVIVSIEAINPATGTIHKLSEEQLNTIELVDYDYPTMQLPTDWAYSDEENEFNHVLPAIASTETPQAEVSNPNANPQKKTWWVLTWKVERKNIGARIKTLNGTVHHTGGGIGHSDSHVTIIGQSPIHYDMSNVRFDREDRIIVYIGSYMCEQYNFYLSSARHRFQNVEVTKGSFFDPATDPPIDRCYLRVSSPPHPRFQQFSFLHYLWPMGPQQTRQVGNKNAHTNITINQRPGALCFTSFSLTGRPPLYGDSAGWYEKHFKVYDEYGNWGHFKASHSNGFVDITVSALNAFSDGKVAPREAFTPISPQEAASIDPGN
ncbi:hypothetical protein CNMCM8980_006551 [Aspergillus fumigatiaffinis]|uniref:Uncharacterized protein n=1 Tax=Aspergillus fumigatiaffinis TaxID=340414 RepID=A0A8H4M6R4_9EURO|nr:hypothetical protein CNMCM8980_006551 [Aspergillus fumigatiaffinis]KAF4232223.1 hypothetical protein CNMCM6805_010059 [Aspergillus fumigatiaffinis]